MILMCLGGFLGAITRYGCQLIFPKKGVATWLVNSIGSLLIGFTLAYTLPLALYSLFVVGFLGAFTTFSTFMLDTLQLSKQRPLTALFYVVGTLISGYGAAWLGFSLGQMMLL